MDSWVKEFYPNSAQDCAEISGGEDTALIRHALRKWTGARSENLQKHGDLAYPPIPLNSETCALCLVHLDRDKDEPCSTCPLARYLGGACDKGRDAPFVQYFVGGGPEPMIKALEGTLQMVKRETVANGGLEVTLRINPHDASAQVIERLLRQMSRRIATYGPGDVDGAKFSVGSVTMSVSIRKENDE